MSENTQATNLDARLTPYRDVDPANFSRACATALAELADMVKRPVADPNNVDYRAANVTIKYLFPQVDNNEALIDYNRDNHTPQMRGNSSSDEWAAFMVAAVRYARQHPEVNLQLQPNGYGPQLAQPVLDQIIAEGRVIHQRYDSFLRGEQLLEGRARIVPGQERTQRRGGRQQP